MASGPVPAHYKSGAVIEASCGCPVVVIDVSHGKVKAGWLRAPHGEGDVIVAGATIGHDFNRQCPLYRGVLTDREEVYAMKFLLNG